MKYTWETDEDVEWWCHDEFDSIGDCIADAKKNYGIPVGSTIAVGISEPFEVNVDADMILDSLEEDAYDKCGEYAETWRPTSNKREDKEQLSEEVTKIVKAWLAKHNDMPAFYRVRGVKTIKVY